VIFRSSPPSSLLSPLLTRPPLTKLAQVALNQLRSIDFFPDLPCWQGTLHAAFKKNVSGNEILELLREMECFDDFPPGSEIFQMVLEYFIQNNFTDSIEIALAEMKERKVPVSLLLQERLGMRTP
jgi:hypothetical protein